MSAEAVAELTAPAAPEAPAAPAEPVAGSADQAPVGKSPAPGVAPLTPKPQTNRQRAIAKAKPALGLFNERKKADAAPSEKTEEPAPKDEAKPESEKPAEDEKAKALAEIEEAKRKAEADLKAKEDEQYRKFRQKQKREKEQRAADDRARELLRAKQAEYEADQELKARDFPAWLEKHGGNFLEYAKEQVAKEVPPEQKAALEKEAATAKELKELREWRAAMERREAERAQREAVKEVHAEIASNWTTAKPQYPTLSTYYKDDEVTEAAVEVRLNHYRATRKADAARRGVPEDQGRGVEASLSDVYAHLEKRAKEHSERFTPRQNAERAERATAVGKPAETRAATRPTVTNRDSATRAGPTTPLSREERRQRAIDKVRQAGWADD